MRGNPCIPYKRRAGTATSMSDMQSAEDGPEKGPSIKNYWHYSQEEKDKIMELYALESQNVPFWDKLLKNFLLFSPAYTGNKKSLRKLVYDYTVDTTPKKAGLQSARNAKLITKKMRLQSARDAKLLKNERKLQAAQDAKLEKQKQREEDKQNGITRIQYRYTHADKRFILKLREQLHPGARPPFEIWQAVHEAFSKNRSEPKSFYGQSVKALRESAHFWTRNAKSPFYIGPSTRGGGRRKASATDSGPAVSAPAVATQDIVFQTDVDQPDDETTPPISNAHVVTSAGFNLGDVDMDGEIDLSFADNS